MLKVNDLYVRFSTSRGPVFAVNGISWCVEGGETLGVVGESGSGKSTACLSLLGLLPPGAVTSGEAIFEGQDLLRLPRNRLRQIRGKEIAMVFQDPMTSLNPVLSISTQIAEVTRTHLGHSVKEGRSHALRMLELVGIADAHVIARARIHQLSGGMRQRVMIAMALACRPKLLIADEPTSSLDATIQAQILDLIRAVRDQTGTSVILVSHDLGVIAEMADRVSVIYAGRVVETAPRDELFRNPQHPYTRALLKAIPDPSRRGAPLYEIGGQPPDAGRLPERGCLFAERCPEVQDKCRLEFPPFLSAGKDHRSLCHFSIGRCGHE